MSVSLYDYTPFHRNIHSSILYAQTAEHYTTEEIQHLYSLCRSVYERDYLVDRLYLASQHNRRGKKKDEYYYYSARQMSRDPYYQHHISVPEPRSV
jgi:hypothetical protein